MQTSAGEMKLLSKRFYGNKYFFVTHYEVLKTDFTNEELVSKTFKEIQSAYYEEMEEIGICFVNYLHRPQRHQNLHQLHDQLTHLLL